MSCQPGDFGFGVGVSVITFCFVFFMLLISEVVRFQGRDPKRRALRRWNRRVAKEAKRYLSLGIHPEGAFDLASAELLRHSRELSEELGSAEAQLRKEGYLP